LRNIVNAKGDLVAAWVGPIITVASMCQHLDGSVDRHRVLVLDLGPLLEELSYGIPGPIVTVPLGGIQVGQFGIVLKGYAATDIHAVMRNVVWEDEHCLACCGALIKFAEPLHHHVLIRCGPTIGLSDAEARRLTDEYWSD
jgi:hypothetical protein